MDFQFDISLTDGYKGHCYLQLVSPFDVISLGRNKEITNILKDDNIETSKLISKISEIVKNRTQIYIIVNVNHETKVLVSKNQGICFTLEDVENYSCYVDKYQKNGDLVNTYNIDSKKYVSIINREMSQMLIELCHDSYMKIYNKLPDEIYFKVTSNQEHQNSITNNIPTDVFKYCKIDVSDMKNNINKSDNKLELLNSIDIYNSKNPLVN